MELPILMVKLDRWLPLPANAGRSPPPIDRTILAEAAGGDADLEQHVLAQFRSVNRDDVEKLEHSVGARDALGVCRAAHRIKGASMAIGALALADVCQRLESAARAEDWLSVAAQHEPFRGEVARLSDYLEELVHE
ncbi:MAG TPA: Hpt domain-containing protein [Usitatibacter sp.]|nr:Hpt domain-containing protein [Usitatibacter sp.]